MRRTACILSAMALLGSPSAAQTIFATAFDDATGWTFDGFGNGEWAVDATPAAIEELGYCNPPGPDSWVSAPNSLNFNDGLTIGGPGISEGRATSPVIDLTGSTEPELRFQAAWCYEDKCGHDVATLRISNDGFATTVLELCFTAQAGPAGQWDAYAFALDPDWGAIEIQFEFDTVDSLFNGGAGWFVDDLEVRDCAPLPENYCVGAANSAGPGATMGYTGSVSVAANNLRLQADGCPPKQLSLFLCSQNQNMVPNGNGFFCLAGPFYRIYPASPTGSSGVPTKALDITSPPSPAAQILPGSTWNFINWYRDPPAGGAMYNFSDGLEVTFCN